MRNFFLYLLFCCFIIAGCCKKPRKETHSVVTKLFQDFEDPSVSDKATGESFQGRFFSRLNKEKPFSQAIEYFIPDSVNGSIRVCLDFYARLSDKRFGQAMVITLQNRDSLFMWKQLDINSYTYDLNTWVHIQDSVQFLKEGPYTMGQNLRIFGFHNYRKGGLDLDNIGIIIKKIDYSSK